MEVEIRRQTRIEIIVDKIPIGNILLDDDGKVHWAELYDDFVHTKYEAELLKQFADKINEYEWVDK